MKKWAVNNLLYALAILLPIFVSLDVLAVPAKLKYEPLFILKEVLGYKNLKYRPEIPLPELFLSSATPVEFFQEDIFPQWGFKPDLINAYVGYSNHIYLFDDQTYYTENKRCMDDSMAHELAHYVQLKYRGWDLNDESLEWDAVETQTWFAKTIAKT